MRAIAESMLTEQSRDAFLCIADQYDRMAQSAQSTWELEQSMNRLISGPAHDPRQDGARE